MKHAAKSLLLAGVAVLANVAVTLAATPVRAQALSVNEAQKSRLKTLVDTDGEARALFAGVMKQADAAMADAPNPVAKIVSEGTLASDSRKIRTGVSLRDMGKMEALAWAGVMTGKAEYARKAREYLLAWARTNQPDGDPINETKLEPLFVADDLVGAGFAPDDRKTVDDYLRAVAAAEERSGAKGKATSHNNWHSHRIKIVGLIGYALHDATLIAWATDAYRRQIAANLRPDGSSFDFHERDALHYHLYDIEPLLVLAEAARQNDGADWFHEKSAQGTSLAQSVAWVVPFATGEKTHGEFVHSRVAFDRKRAQAGEKGYAPGTPFDPRTARTVFEAATVWEPDTYRPLALRLLAPEGKIPAARFGSWRMVVQEARR